MKIFSFIKSCFTTVYDWFYEIGSNIVFNLYGKKRALKHSEKLLEQAKREEFLNKFRSPLTKKKKYEFVRLFRFVLTADQDPLDIASWVSTVKVEYFKSMLEVELYNARCDGEMVFDKFKKTIDLNNHLVLKFLNGAGETIYEEKFNGITNGFFENKDAFDYSKTNEAKIVFNLSYDNVERKVNKWEI